MKLSEKLKQLREQNQYTIQELAEKSGVSNAYIRQIENKLRTNPSGKMLKKLAAALGTTVADLISAPTTISEQTIRQAPKSLQEFIKKQGKRHQIRQEDIHMLQAIHYRGKQPACADDWELIYLFIKRIIMYPKIRTGI